MCSGLIWHFEAVKEAPPDFMLRITLHFAGQKNGHTWGRRLQLLDPLFGALSVSLSSLGE